MVEVFKTNIQTQRQAVYLLDRLYNEFGHYSANFDLEDRDRILRVECPTGSIAVKSVMAFLEGLGCYAKVLPDTVPHTEIGPQPLLTTLGRKVETTVDISVKALR
jgi:hypothetical protein